MRLITMASIGLFALLAACNPTQKEATEEPATIDAPKAGDQPEFSEGMDLGQRNLIIGKSFLDENKIRDGVQITETGLQYKVLESGPEDGKNPFPGQFVCVHYQGTSIAGEEFDSSYSRGLPAAFPSNRLIKGWIEALGMMRAGDEWMLYVPSDLAYGSRGTFDGSIGPNQTLVFKINLIKLLDLTVEQYQQTYAVDRTLDCSAAP